MRIAFGSDEEGELPNAVVGLLEGLGHEVQRVAVGEQWPEVGRAVAQAVTSGDADRGVVCCWTGTGVSIAANKVHGARAALCTDAATAEGARRWNDANILALSLRLTSPQVAREMIEVFLSTAPEPSEQEAVSRLETPR